MVERRAKSLKVYLWNIVRPVENTRLGYSAEQGDLRSGMCLHEIPASHCLGSEPSLPFRWRQRRDGFRDGAAHKSNSHPIPSGLVIKRLSRCGERALYIWSASDFLWTPLLTESADCRKEARYPAMACSAILASARLDENILQRPLSEVWCSLHC